MSALTHLALPPHVALNWPLALQGPDSPNGNILGWLIVFFMIVWPILRGAIEAANERRRKFVEQERRRGRASGPSGGSAAGPMAPTGRPKLEGRDPFEALRRAMEQARQDQERQEEEADARRAAPPAAAAPTRVPAQYAPKAPPQSLERDPRPVVRQDTFGRDPFDDAQLERPLVRDPELARVPSEGGQATETPRRRPAPPPEPPIDAPTPVVEPLLGALSSRGRAVPVGGFALQRIAQRVPSPWGRAVLYEELLGPPIALREPRN